MTKQEHFVDREKEFEVLHRVISKLRHNNKFEITPEDTLILNVSPDYSSIISMYLLHEFSKEGEILDMFPIEVPYPDQLPAPFQLKFEETFKDYASSYKNFVLIEAGVISGRNYTWITDSMKRLFDINKDDITTVALFENIHSEFKSDVVGEYYDHEKQDLTFYFEKFNKHF